MTLPRTVDEIIVRCRRYVMAAAPELVVIDAFAQIARRRHRPDAVITDGQMPHPTGMQLCREVRNDPHLAHVPVLLVSGSVDPRDSQALADAGITTVIGKPFQVPELLQRLDEVLAHP